MSARPPLCEIQPRRVALIKPSALGDIVHALPVLTALRRRFPDAHLTWVVNRAYEPLLAGHRDLDSTLAFDRAAARGGWLAAARAYGGFFRRLRAERFDLVIDLQGLLRSGLMTAATRAARRVGLAGAREGAGWFYTDSVPVAGRRALHAVDRYWQAAVALGATGEKEFHVPLSDEAKRWAEDALEGRPRPWLMLAAGARWHTKRWAAEHFAALASRARARFGGTAVFVGGADDAPISAAVRARLTGPALDLTGKTTLPRLAAVLARADLVLANDTGPLHLAAALGRPVAAAYTCTRVALTGPYGCAGAVATRVRCAGSLRKKCGRMDCLTELTPERLWPVVAEVLAGWQSRQTA